MQIALHTAQETCQSAAHFHCCKSTSGVETCQCAKYSSRLYKTIWELELCSFTITRVHVEWLRVKGEKKSSSHAHLCQPTSLGSFGSSRRNGPSRAVIAVAVLWKYFCVRKLSLERFIVWFVGQYMAPNQWYFLSDCGFVTCHVCRKKKLTNA